jgi:hypothetical protein
MTLTWHAEGARAAVSDAGGIQHAHRPIMFWASLLWVECCPLPTTQGAIRLWEKILSPKASSSRCVCPVWWTKG